MIGGLIGAIGPGGADSGDLVSGSGGLSSGPVSVNFSPPAFSKGIGTEAYILTAATAVLLLLMAVKKG